MNSWYVQRLRVRSVDDSKEECINNYTVKDQPFLNYKINNLSFSVRGEWNVYRLFDDEYNGIFFSWDFYGLENGTSFVYFLRSYCDRWFQLFNILSGVDSTTLFNYSQE